MDTNNWWMSLYHGNEEIRNESGYITEEEAKDECLRAYVNDILKK